MLNELDLIKRKTGNPRIPNEIPISPEVPDGAEGSLYTACSCGQLIPRDIIGNTIRCRACRTLLYRKDVRRTFKSVDFNIPLSEIYDPKYGAGYLLHMCGEKIPLIHLSHTRNLAIALRCRRCGVIIYPYAYRCPECGIACASKQDLEVHLLDHPRESGGS